MDYVFDIWRLESKIGERKEKKGHVTLPPPPAIDGPATREAEKSILCA